MLLSEVLRGLANYFPSSQGDAGLPGAPGLSVSSRHLHLIRLSGYGGNSKRARYTKGGQALKWLDGVLLNIKTEHPANSTVCKGRCKDWNQQRGGETVEAQVSW